jgi:hypothetical protein
MKHKNLMFCLREETEIDNLIIRRYSCKENVFLSNVETNSLQQCKQNIS